MNKRLRKKLEGMNNSAKIDEIVNLTQLKAPCFPLGIRCEISKRMKLFYRQMSPAALTTGGSFTTTTT